MAVLLDKNKLGYTDTTFLNLYFNHDHNVWVQKDIIQEEVQSSYKGSFVINILGQLYYLIPDIGTYIYDLKDKKWKESHPVIDNKILQDSAKLSVVRVPSGLLSVA